MHDNDCDCEVCQHERKAEELYKARAIFPWMILGIAIVCGLIKLLEEFP